MLRDDAVLRRAEERGLRTHQEQDPDQVGVRPSEAGAREHEAQGGEQHDDDLEEFDPPHDPGLLVFVRDLASDGRE